VRWGLALVTLAATAAAVFGGRIVLLVVLLAVAGLATLEFLRLARARGVVPAEPVALFGTAGILVLAFVGEERAPRLYPGVLAAFLLLAFGEILARRDRTNVTRAVALTMLPVFTVGVFASFLLALRGMPDGSRLLLVLVAMVGAAEIGQEIAGRIRGGSLDAWLRLVAAQAGVFVVALVVGVLDTGPFTWPTLITLAVLTGAAAPIGRLATQMIDRDLRSTEPALAAVALLVRIDGLLLAAPVFFYAFRALAR
jgi:CDP-diglyceride synthetase